MSAVTTADGDHFENFPVAESRKRPLNAYARLLKSILEPRLRRNKKRANLFRRVSSKTMKAQLRNAKFAIVFHGPAVGGILDDEHYTTKFRTTNPNLKPIAEMKKHGVEFSRVDSTCSERKSIQKR